MKTYKYYSANNVLLCEAKSPVKFNLKLFPIFGNIEPVVTETTYKSKSAGIKETEEK